ncbi:MAG: hypothetical protein ACI95C_001478 [Pseudohongiellaceae bacterium]|jgi:hypothetical protein
MNTELTQAAVLPRRFVIAGLTFFGLLLSPLLRAQSIDDVVLNVYKSETCGCCVGWIEHMEANSYHSTISHPTDLDAVKQELGVKPQWASCHTAVSKEGFVFEGHIPAKFIDQFLANPPAGALGLTVPGMPIGGPGMEMGNRFTPYDILLMNTDGTSKVFASIKSALDQ